MSTPLRVFIAIEATLSYVPGILLRYYPFKPKLSRNQKTVLFLVYTAITLLNILLLFVSIRDLNTATGLVRLDMLLIQVALVLTNIIGIRGYIKEHLFTFGVSSTCMYMLLSVSSFLPHCFGGLNDVHKYLLGTGFYICLSITGYIPVRYLLKRTVTPFLSREFKDYWKGVWFIPLLLYISMFLALPIQQSIETISTLLSRLFISVSGVIIAIGIANNHKNLMEKQLLAEQLNISKVYYASLQAKVESSRKINHDMKHILGAIRHYIETDDKSGLSEFCDSTEEEQLAHSRIPYTGNTAADGVIYHYIKRADESGIRFRYKGRIPEKGLSDMDMCVLLGNALDNALTGCLTADGDRCITVTSETDDNTDGSGCFLERI